MKKYSIFLLIFASTALSGEYEWIDFYTGGSAEGTYIWTWGFAEEPGPVEDTGFTPGTAAVEVKWGKAEGFDAGWTSYGVYFGDIGFDIEDIVPDSVYFKLRAPEGEGESDRLVVWLYDPRNTTWDNALFYELDNFQILQDKEWHQFSVSLWDFQVNVDEIDYTNIIAVSLERPAEDEDTKFPLMYIDHVWIGLPDFVSVDERPPTRINSFSLQQNYPNPFNPVTTLSYSIPAILPVTLKIYDTLGKEIATIVDEQQSAGTHTASFGAADLPSGIYFCKLRAGSRLIDTKKMMLLK
ncbi:T9SS type A sorting domain-containing protein [candidate division KSB1 bacterium]|nr:T9SS type A sorting domain-containing protein [candidate division KSB1 bacterium]